VIHLRLLVPADRVEPTLACLEGWDSVTNVVHLPGAARKPTGDVVLADVAREDTSVVVHDLKELGLSREGSISLEEVDTAISRVADDAERAAPGAPSDAVVWEEVEDRTSEEAKLSGTFLLFMVVATLIASVGIYLDSPILIIGAMVVGPEFGPIAGLCVALVTRRPQLAGRSATVLAVGFPLAIAVTLVAALIFRGAGIAPDTLERSGIGKIIASPDFFSFFVAFAAGVIGMLSLSTAKSGALIGVLISVTTIPAAADVAVSAAYGDGGSFRGSLLQLLINLGSILLAGVLTLAAQRALYARRRARVSRAGPRPRASSSRARSRRT
jgi:uncharacterized hydrophobic protein (TIGR00271 family)